ncbi:3-phytase [Fusarium keratoplasticum]|uniref:3-phytase n=1 Tax=Fusarium keratoplasticum TaxID=1328300 RepID=A0ACC0RGY8_9HYPO|nr:3-phytase [Fusarium keratoplasticum]KAI8684303.1 3-phytase [Fusarium keratoplasticum]KAI8688416.1 3-phytase [Fusarium keratoplasticum]
MAASSAPREPKDGYHLVHQDDSHDDGHRPPPVPPVMPRGPVRTYRNMTLLLSGLVVILLGSNLYLSLPYAFSGSGCDPPRVPQYFQTSPQLWPGATATGKPAFMAQTHVFEPTATFVPNDPLQTSIPIEGMKEGNQSIFKMMGYLSPYSPSPGFGVDEYPIPQGAEIVQVQMLSRHGARYPTPGSNVAELGERLANASGKFNTRGALSFLNDWKYELGYAILVPRGRQELFESGVLHAYMYGSLYNPQSKLIVRTTTQDRMLKSAENWMAGFFGLEWTNNATIEVIIEAPGFNNSLAGGLGCPNAAKADYKAPVSTWVEKYLQDATDRFNNMTEGFKWTPEDVYAAQTMCPYETVAYGFSMFCDLFTYEEWQGFGYSVDLAFASGAGFHSPVGRAIGLGYQQEVIARLKNHTLGYSGSQINTTLDSMEETFPLNQSLYFDFSHDTNIVSILTAFGFRQFAEKLPADEYPGDHNFTVAHVTPFGARLDIEIIKAPKPVSPDRTGYLEGEETKYIHFVLNQRTLPLGKSFPECDANRKDGWCELDTFLKVQEEMVDKAQFDYACFGDYPSLPYGEVTDGVPPS